MAYAVVTASNSTSLEAFVLRRLELGWECQGGVSAAWNASGWLYLQAMVKKGV